MASPKIVEFKAYNATTGAPLAGQAGLMTFHSYKDETGTNLSQPTIVEIGLGSYYFTPTFASPSHGISFLINLGSGATPQYVGGYLRPEDYNLDNADVASSTINTTVNSIAAALTAAASDITLLKKLTVGKWKIFDSGPNQNKMIFYDTDGTTPLLTVQLYDANGVPGTANPFERIPE